MTMALMAAELRLTLLLLGVVRWMLANTASVGQQIDYQEPVSFRCPRNQHLSTVKSVHSNSYEDRMWEFECRAFQGANFTPCTWYTLVNDVHGPLVFRCPYGRVIAGAGSYFETRYEDRRFAYRCCDLIDKSLDECQPTGHLNQFEEDMNYTVPTGHVIVGFKSIYANILKDRRWHAEICTLKSA